MTVTKDSAPESICDCASQSPVRGLALSELHRLIEVVAPHLPEPESSPPFYMAINAHRCGRTTDAAAGYLAILAQDATHAGAAFSLGVLYLTTGKIDLGLGFIENVIRNLPEKSEHFAAFGRLLALLDRPISAVPNLLAALRLKPHSAAVEVFLAEVYGRMLQSEEALYHSARALEIDKRSERAWTIAGRNLVTLGRLEEAGHAFERAIEANPSSGGAYLGLADLGAIEPNTPQFTLLDKVASADSSKMDEMDIALCQLALGRSLEQSKQYREALSYYIKAKATIRRSHDYNESRALGRLQRITEVFSPGVIDAMGTGDTSPIPIFIVGMPRSGSTLVEQVLTSHPLTFGAGEIPDFGWILHCYDVSIDTVADISPDVVRRLGRAYVRQLTRYSRSSERIVNKQLGNFEWIGLIRAALPNAKIIHTFRDPVDTCLSCFSKPIPPPYVNDLGELGRFYSQYHKLMCHWGRTVPADSILHIGYEDMVVDFETKVRSILDFCNLSWNDKCLQFYKTRRPVHTVSSAQVRRPLYADHVGRWRECYDLLQPLLAGLGLEARL